MMMPDGQQHCHHSADEDRDSALALPHLSLL